MCTVAMQYTKRVAKYIKTWICQHNIFLYLPFKSFSEYHLIKYGVPQGVQSVLRPVLFNIFLCDLFLIVNDIDIASYADDNTPYCTSNIQDDVKVTLKAASIKVFQWF